jgi:hypothetical protein
MANCALQGVVTDVGRAAMAQSILGPLVRPPYAESYFKYFKIGEGGFILGPGGSKQPKTPDPSLTDLESASNPTLFTFQKDFVAGDLSVVIDSSIYYANVRAFLDYSEANDDGFGNYPEFFEIGLFDANDVMLVYATIPGETKNSSKTLNHYLNINF